MQRVGMSANILCICPPCRRLPRDPVCAPGVDCPARLTHTKLGSSEAVRPDEPRRSAQLQAQLRPPSCWPAPRTVGEAAHADRLCTSSGSTRTSDAPLPPTRLAGLPPPTRLPAPTVPADQNGHGSSTRATVITSPCKSRRQLTDARRLARRQRKRCVISRHPCRTSR